MLLLDRLDLPDPVYGTVAAAVLQRAQEAGFKTSVDLVSEDSDRFAGIVRPALRFCDYCVLNEFEAERTTASRSSARAESTSAPPEKLLTNCSPQVCASGS